MNTKLNELFSIIKRDGKYYVQCTDGEIEKSKNEIIKLNEANERTLKYLKKAMEYTHNSEWTICTIPSEFNSIINIDLFFDSIIEWIDKEPKQKETIKGIYLLWLNEIKTQIANPLLEKKKAINEYLKSKLELLISIIDLTENNQIQEGLKCKKKLDQEKFEQLVIKLKDNKMISTDTPPDNFLYVFQACKKPKKWEKVKWVGSRKNCFSFMMGMCGDDILPKAINEFIQQYAINQKTKMLNTKPLISGDRWGCKAGLIERLK